VQRLRRCLQRHSQGGTGSSQEAATGGNLAVAVGPETPMFNEWLIHKAQWLINVVVNG